jgi:serine/threonine protein kinase
VTLPVAEAIFLELSNIEPDDRAAFLDARCGADAGLRSEVEALVSALDLASHDFLDPERIPTLDMAAVDGPLQPGTHLGAYLVLHALGSGGMGVVYAAQQDRPRRTVAIKVLRRGFRHPEILRRFEQEAEMLGRLQHPGIAQVYAFCTGDRTTPAYLVMELVSGPPMTDYARAQRLSIADRVKLLVTLADAVQHAHGRGIIHRDLKPANVLVGEDGQPKVLDFGIARATGADMQRLTMHTAHGQLMGTLAYMSPEQLSGRSDDIDARSDVYALGILLYRLLTERLPFDVSDVTWPVAIQRVLESTPAPMASVNPALSGSLEHIVSRAMSRDIASRYQTAAGLAADLRRFLAGSQPAAASPEPAVKLERTVRDLETLIPPTALAVDADTIVVATRSGIVARSLSTGNERWTAPLERVRVLAAGAPARHVAAALESGAIEVLDIHDGARLATLDRHRGPVVALAFGKGGDLVSVGRDGAVYLWAPLREQPVGTLLHYDGGPATLTPLPDGRMILAGSDGRVQMIAVPGERL